jgi:membrane protease YdiL (CAAX protease family)
LPVTIELAVGVLVAAGAWAAMFLGSRRHFWTRAALAAAVIAGYAVAVDPTAIGRLFAHGDWWPQVLIGLGGGAALYGVFWVGEQLLVVVLPSLADEVGDLYRVRGETRLAYMPLVLIVAAPGEEIFFRGFVQHRAGFAVALIVYGAVHLAERKWILVIAALVGGAAWGGLFAYTGGLVAPVVSHLAWALAVVVWAPIAPAPRATAAAATLRARRVTGAPERSPRGRAGRGSPPGGV